MSEEKKEKNEIAVLNYSPEELSKLSGFAEDDGSPSDVERLPILRINYTPMVTPPEQALKDQALLEKSKKQPLSGKFPSQLYGHRELYDSQGAYVLGQKKDANSKVVVAGEEVTQIIIFKTRNQFNYYDQKDTHNNCHSPVHEDFKKVVGNNYAYECGTGCPFRAKDRNPRCQLNKVAFVSAITKSNKPVDAVMYIKGASFMEFVDFMKASVNLEDEKTKKKNKVPSFSFAIKLLPTEFKVNGSVEYYLWKFEKGQTIPIDIVEKFFVKSQEIEEIISFMNQRSVEKDETVEVKEAVPVDDKEVKVVQPGAEQEVDITGIIQQEEKVIEEGEFDASQIYK